MKGQHPFIFYLAVFCDCKMEEGKLRMGKGMLSAEFVS